MKFVFVCINMNTDVLPENTLTK